MAAAVSAVGGILGLLWAARANLQAEWGDSGGAALAIRQHDVELGLLCRQLGLFLRAALRALRRPAHAFGLADLWALAAIWGQFWGRLGFYRVYRVLSGLIVPYGVLSGLIGSYRVLLGLIGSYRVLSGLIGSGGLRGSQGVLLLRPPESKGVLGSGGLRGYCA